MAKGYIVGMITINDLDPYKPYMAQTSALVHEYGGRYLIRGGAMTIAEGDMQHDRVVVIEFDSPETVKKFYDDPRYVETRKIRQDHSTGTILHIDGFDG